MTTREVGLADTVIAVRALDQVILDTLPAEQREALGHGLLILEGDNAINDRMAQALRRVIGILSELPIDQDRRTLAHARVILWQAISDVIRQGYVAHGALQ